VIDGLWMEASALPEAFAPGEVVRIGLTSSGAILGLDLIDALPTDLAPDLAPDVAPDDLLPLEAAPPSAQAAPATAAAKDTA
jgi:hypothetical protein